MKITRVAATAAVLGFVLLIWSAAFAQPARTARIVSPAQGEIVEGPNVTFTVEASGIRLPDEHFHLFIDEAATRYVLGNPIPVEAGFVHFRTLTTTVRLAPGPHIVALVAGDAQHAPLRPLVIDSRYLFVR